MDENKIIVPTPTRQLAVEQLLEQLPNMKRADLLKLWRNLFNREPSPALRRETLIPILAYRIQAQAFGGLKESTARKLSELADDSAIGETASQSSLRPKSGTQYVREYGGKLHEVTVLDSNYNYEGTTYRSLTEITRVITGTNWSAKSA